jgi:alpha-mannosidase
MLNPNVEAKLSRTVKELKRLATLEVVDIKDVYYTDEVNLNDLNTLPSDDLNWQILTTPHLFDKAHKYYWIKMSVDILPQDKHIKSFFSFNLGLTNYWITIRPQGLLYVNGEITQGLDVRHEDVYLKPGHYDLLILFYTHSLEEKFFLQPQIKLVDERIYNAYWDFCCPLQAFEILDQKDDDYFLMSPVLEKACNEIDFRDPYSEDFYKSLEAAHTYMYDNFYNGICGSNIKVNIIGHSHIDVAWLWDYAQTRQKVKRTFSTVIKLMDEYPEYNFMSSTPQLYEFVKEDAPELYEKIKQKHKEGRWEIEGALWLECDCNLTGGEALVRQIVHGKRFIKQEFDVDSKVVWLPDVFGYSGALPQIMRKAGVEHFVTAKIGWNDTNRFPYDTFIWKGIDGSDVTAYLISTADRCNPRQGIYDITYTTYTPDICATHILATWHRYTQKDYSNTVFLTMGWGDGGGGATREMLEAQRRFSYGVPGIPKTSMSTVKDTISEINQNFNKSSEELKRKPTWSGELYFEFHRGTLTSVPMVKKYNRDSEYLLTNAETISEINKHIFKDTVNKDLINKNWKKVLLNQFHDVLPGSSIEKVYEDARVIYESLFSEIKPVYNDGVNKLLNNIKGKGYAIYNPNAFNVTSNVTLNGQTYIVNDIPSLGYKVVDTLANASEELIVKDRYLENQYYIVKFNLDGSISSLFDKKANRELVYKNQPFNQLVAYEDMAFEYDNWELAYYHKQKAYPLTDEANFEIIKENQKVAIKVTKKYGKSSITQTFALYDNFDRIDVNVDLDWKEQFQILKVLFPIDLHFDDVNYDVQFGHIARCAHSNTSIDAACFESVGHKYIDASENNYGFAILNDGKYGFGAEENVLSMSLIKSAHFPNEQANKVIPSFTYSLLPHKGNLTSSEVIRKSYVLNRPLIARVIDNPNGTLPREYSFLEVLTEGVNIEAIKEAYDSDLTVIRLVESFKERKTVTVRFAHPISEAYILDLLENKETSLEVIDSHTVNFEIKPFEIITLGVK